MSEQLLKAAEEIELVLDGIAWEGTHWPELKTASESLKQGIAAHKEAEQEPVAWTVRWNGDDSQRFITNDTEDIAVGKAEGWLEVPLYTNPAQMRRLSEDEIGVIFDTTSIDGTWVGYLNFANAIQDAVIGGGE